MKILFVLMLLPVLCMGQKSIAYKNMVMEGGGIRGLAYAGVFSVLEERGILQKIENVGGSSAGAIAGLMISVGYTAKEIDSLLVKLPIEKFNDGRGGVFGKYKRFKNNFGFYKGEKVETWLQELIALKTGNPNLSFEELHQLHLANTTYKDFYCTGTNLSKQQLEVFSYKNTPSMPLALAVKISGNLPFYFEPVVLDNQMQKIKKTDTISFANYYVDGGLLCNFPICMFDTCEDDTNPLLCDKVKFNKQTIGIKLERPEQITAFNNNNVKIPAYNIKSRALYVGAFFNVVLETMNRKYPNLENEKGRTIYVDQGSMSPRVRKVSPAEKEILFSNGMKATLEFLNKEYL